MPKKGKKSKKGGQAEITRPRELSAQALVCEPDYFNRVVRYGKFELDTYTCVMSIDSLYNADGSGTNATVYASSPSGTANWSNAAGLYDEYRVLGFTVKFRPFCYNGQVVTQAPIIAVVDMDTATALTGYSLGAEYSSDVEYPGGRSWSKLALMSGAENAMFTSTASPASFFWIKTYTSNNTVSANLGRVLVQYLVQFRGKGI